MKSIKVLFLVLFFPIALIAQDTTKSNVSDTAKLTLSRVYSDVKSGIQGLGSALKVGSEHVYVVLVKQQVVKSIVWLCIFLIDFLFIWYIFRYWKWFIKNESFSDDYNFGWAALGIVLSIVCCVFTIACMTNIETIITGFVNPEYGAIKDIFDFIKPKQ